MMERLFLRHPRSLGETYGEHQAAALRISASLFGAAFACFVHALAPGLFETTASRTIRRLNQGLGQRHRAPPTASASEALEYQI